MMRRRFVVALALGAAVIFVAFIAAQILVAEARQFIFTSADVTLAQAVIVPGASVLRDGTPSDILEDRLLTAIALYGAGKAPKILVSGDNGQEGYDEVNAMKAYLLTAGVAPEDVFLDHAGFDTYDTMYRARAVFGVSSAIIATQEYHLPRALYIGKAVGMDVGGVIADRQPYVAIVSFRLREMLANVKAVFDVIMESKPTYLGDTIPIDGDGRATWD